MFAVGMDKLDSLILYSQHRVRAKISVLNIELNNNKGKTGNNYSTGWLETKEIIFGCLLGDGTLEIPPRGLNARFGFIQSESNKEYFISVCNSLSKICSGKYREYSQKRKNTLELKRKNKKLFGTC